MISGSGDDGVADGSCAKECERDGPEDETIRNTGQSPAVGAAHDPC